MFSVFLLFYFCMKKEDLVHVSGFKIEVDFLVRLNIIIILSYFEFQYECIQKLIKVCMVLIVLKSNKNCINL